MKFRAVLAAAVASGAVALAASAATASAATLPTVTVGYTSEGGLQIPSYVAEDLGYFKKDGLNVKLVDLNSSTALIPALTGGSVDIGTGDGAALCAGYLSGSQIKVFGANLSNFALEGWSTDSINSVKQLKGQTVGVTALGSTSYFALAAALQANGMKLSDVKLVYLRSISATVPALTRGSIQATFIVPPLGKTFDQTKFHRFYNTSSLKHVSTAFAAESSYVQQNPTVIKDYLKAMKQAVAFAAKKSNQATVAKLVAKNAGVSTTLGQYAFQYFQPLWDKTLGITSANWNTTCKEAEQTTKPKAGIKPAGALDLSLL